MVAFMRLEYLLMARKVSKSKMPPRSGGLDRVAIWDGASDWLERASGVDSLMKVPSHLAAVRPR